MFDGFSGSIDALSGDRDEQAIRSLFDTLKGEVSDIDERVAMNLLLCATMAIYRGRQMGLAGKDAFDALAALCLVLGERRTEFFENVFLRRLMDNPQHSPQQKLNRVVEIVIGTIPRPVSRGSNDNPIREFA